MLLLEEYPALDPSQHVMMVCKPGERPIQLDDQQTVGSAIEVLAQGAECELHILPRKLVYVLCVFWGFFYCLKAHLDSTEATSVPE